MRFFEFDNPAERNVQLLSVLKYLQGRAHDKNLSASLRTQSLINLVKNAGDSAFSYDSLVAAHEADPAVKNLIKNFNQDTVTLVGPDSETSSHGQETPTLAPEVTVDTMAKRALGRRT